MDNVFQSIGAGGTGSNWSVTERGWWGYHFPSHAPPEKKKRETRRQAWDLVVWKRGVLLAIDSITWTNKFPPGGCQPIRTMQSTHANISFIKIFIYLIFKKSILFLHADLNCETTLLVLLTNCRLRVPPPFLYFQSFHIHISHLTITILFPINYQRSDPLPFLIN